VKHVGRLFLFNLILTKKGKKKNIVGSQKRGKEKDASSKRNESTSYVQKRKRNLQSAANLKNTGNILVPS
jgi:hypothetical protein